MKKTMRKTNLIGPGAYTAIITPMTEGGAIDEDSLKNLIEWQIAGGVTGIIPCGTTGESATLTTEEQLRVVELTIRTVAGRVPVIAGAGANSTAEAIELTGAMRWLGADAVLSVTPYYNRPSQEGVYQHYRQIANRTDMPIVLYNVPTRTGFDLSPETVKRLTSMPGIIGINLRQKPLLIIHGIIRGEKRGMNRFFFGRMYNG